MEQKDNLLDVIRTLLKWRKPLIIVGTITALTSVIISLVLPNYYQANTTFLAVSPDQAMPELVFSTAPIRTEYYGNENDIDRLLTIAESNELVDFLIDTFQLFEHYDIAPDHPKARYLVRLAFHDLYEVKKTKRDAIQLSVEDKDRELAMKIANAGRNKIDQFTRQLIRKNLEKTLKTYEESVNTQQKQVDILSDTLMYLRRKFGIFNINLPRIKDDFRHSSNKKHVFLPIPLPISRPMLKGSNNLLIRSASELISLMPDCPLYPLLKNATQNPVRY